MPAANRDSAMVMACGLSAIPPCSESYPFTAAEIHAGSPISAPIAEGQQEQQHGKAAAKQHIGEAALHIFR